MFPKKPTPGESTLKSRSMVAAKSLALMAVPSEYLRPLRSVKVYVFASVETFGRSFARYGTSVAPSGPFACLYPTSGRYTFHMIPHPSTVDDKPGSRYSMPVLFARRKLAKLLPAEAGTPAAVRHDPDH